MYYNANFYRYEIKKTNEKKGENVTHYKGERFG